MEEKHLVEEETPHKGKNSSSGENHHVCQRFAEFCALQSFLKKTLSVLRGLQCFFRELHPVLSVVGK